MYAKPLSSFSFGANVYMMRVFLTELSSELRDIVNSIDKDKYTDFSSGYVDDIDERLIRSIDYHIKNNRIFQADLPPKSKIVLKLLKVCSKDEVNSHNIPHDHEDRQVIMNPQLKAYHIPVITNSETTVSLDGRAFHFQTGRIYTIGKRARGLSIKNEGNGFCLHIVMEFLYFYDVFSSLAKTACTPISVPSWNKDSRYIVSSREGLYMIDMCSKRIDLIIDIGTFGLVKCKERYLVFVGPSQGSKGVESGRIASFVVNEETLMVDEWTVEASGFDNETHQMTFDRTSNNLYVLETGHQRVTVMRITDDGHVDKNVDRKTINIFELDVYNPSYTKVISPDYRHCNSISSDGCRIYVLCSNIYQIDKSDLQSSKSPSIGVFDMQMNLIDEITLDHAKGTYLHEVSLSNGGRSVSYISSDKHVYTLDLSSREIVTKTAFETNEFRWQRGLLILKEDDLAFSLALVGCGTSIQLISRESVKSTLVTPFYPCCIIGL